ncbi:MAG: cytochrome C [Burkholderiales bacterium]|nr:MAG: cytochrome C [Burkholderiales bacterium]
MKRVLKLLGATLALAVVAAAAVLLWAWKHTDTALATRYTPPSIDIAQDVRSAPVAAGERIAQVRNGCIDCHGKDLAGGRVVDDALAGTVYAPNITPAALRGWSDGEIAGAIRTGIRRDGRALVIMPSHEYQHLAREDLAALIAYLRTVPAVERQTPPARVGPVPRLLYAFGKLPTLLPAGMIDASRGFDQKPHEAPTAAFGRYLAAGSCSGCHGAEFRGGPIPGGPPDWAPAASLRLGGDSRWSEEGFVRTMREGRSALDGHALRPPMPVSVLGKLNDVELTALWQFLSTLR